MSDSEWLNRLSEISDTIEAGTHLHFDTAASEELRARRRLTGVHLHFEVGPSHHVRDVSVLESDDDRDACAERTAATDPTSVRFGAGIHLNPKHLAGGSSYVDRSVPSTIDFVAKVGQGVCELEDLDLDLPQGARDGVVLDAGDSDQSAGVGVGERSDSSLDVLQAGAHGHNDSSSVRGSGAGTPDAVERTVEAPSDRAKRVDSPARARGGVSSAGDLDRSPAGAHISEATS